MLLAVPGDSLKVKPEDPPGPGGVLVCAENFVLYMNEGHDTVSCLIPRRSNLPGHRGILLTCAAMHKIPGQFVILAQSEYGDVYKVRMLQRQHLPWGLAGAFWHCSPSSTPRPCNCCILWGSGGSSKCCRMRQLARPMRSLPAPVHCERSLRCRSC
jgi:hypothetical protein